MGGTTAKHQNEKAITPKGPTEGEIRESLLEYVRRAQSSAFSKEIARLKRGQPVDKSSNIAQLMPFIDQLGVLRADGRVRTEKDTQCISCQRRRGKLYQQRLGLIRPESIPEDMATDKPRLRLWKAITIDILGSYTFLDVSNEPRKCHILIIIEWCRGM